MKNIQMIFLAALWIGQVSWSQRQIIDDIVVVVGSEIIARSDVLSQTEQMVAQGAAQRSEQLKCDVLESMIFDKILLNQAYLDSLSVDDGRVESELDRRISVFIRQAGSRENLEKYLGKTIDEARSYFRDMVKKQMLVEQMREKIVGNVKVTPVEVQNFYHSIPKDSLPYIQSEIQLAQLTIQPPVRREEEESVIKKMNDIRDRIIGGRDFGLMASLYSKDEGSKKNEGKIGMVKREELDPDFAAVAFSLKEGEVSKVTKSSFGYHIIRLISKRGEYAEIQHILMIPEVSTYDVMAAEKKLDSIAGAIKNGDSLDFTRAVFLYTEDEDSRKSGGLMINPVTGGSWFALEELDYSTSKVVLNLKAGEISKPVVYNEVGTPTQIRIYYVVGRKEPHVADLQQDYPKIQQAALLDKQDKTLIRWMNDKTKDIFVKINPDFAKCEFRVNWTNNAQ